MGDTHGNDGLNHGLRGGMPLGFGDGGVARADLKRVTEAGAMGRLRKV